MAEAKCYYNAFNRPKILDNDSAGWIPATAKLWMQDLQSNNYLGQIHFDFWDHCLTNWAMEGHPISDETSLPTIIWCELPANQHGGGLGQDWDFAPADILGWFKSELGSNLNNTRLRQNGLLYRPYSGSLPNDERRKLHWVANVDGGSTFEDLPKRLMGYGFMGALDAGDQRLDIEAFLRMLRANNVNFIRVWATEQWTALADPSKQGVAPFAGTPYQRDQQSYDLAADSEAFYNRLRKFAQSAADRGIVVQLSLFDKHGIICVDSFGQYADSPYRNGNNSVAQQYMEDQACSCGTLGGIVDAPDATEPCHPFSTFIDQNHPIASVHSRFLKRVGQEVGGVGNVIFEIINEALAPYTANDGTHINGDWATFGASHPYPNEQWQQTVLGDMRLSLPLESTTASNFVVRDAFNDDIDGVQVSGKQSDIQNANWLPGWTRGATVYVSSTEGVSDGSLGPPRKLGFVSSQESGPDMVGSILIGSGVQWTKLEERADMTCSSGKLQLGLNHSLGSNSVFVMLDCGNVIGGGPIAPKIYLYEKVGGQFYVLNSTIFPDPYALHNVRLELTVDPSSGGLFAIAYLDGDSQIKSDALTDNSDFTSAFFWGSSCNGAPSCIYPKGAGMIDNFEVARFCDDENRGCQP